MKQILVVDDDIHIAELLKLKAAELGYGVATCHSRKSAHAALRAAKPDMIILDVMLGDGLGYSVAREVRSDEQLFHIPILFQSNANDTRDIEYAIEEGGDGFIHKPYTMDDLKQHLSRMHKLSDKLAQRCEITGLPGVALFHRAIDRCLFRNDPIAVCLIAIKGLTIYRDDYGPEAIKRVARITHDTLKAADADLIGEHVQACHLGNGQFLAIVHEGAYQLYREALRDAFTAQHQTLIDAGLESYVSSDKSGAPGNRFALSIHAVHTAREMPRRSSEIFEKLRKMSDEYNKADIVRKRRSANRTTRGHEHWVE